MLLLEQISDFFRSVFNFLYFRNVKKIDNEHHDNYDNYIVDNYDIIPSQVNIMRR